MKRVLLIILLLAIIWVLAYALAYTLREKTAKGFVYPPGGRLDAVLGPLFEPLYLLHARLDPKRAERAHDH